nr:YicC/YloC family endoribonuclease [Pseudaestuariivita rosea]
MTGFATRAGQGNGYSWQWDMRGVNSKGLDLRLRMPDWIDGLEQDVRGATVKKLARGSVTISLRVTREDSEVPIALNDDQLDRVLAALSHIKARADWVGLEMAKPSPMDILQHKGVSNGTMAAEDTQALKKLLLSDLDHLITEFQQVRQIEGQALQSVLQGHIARIGDLTKDAGDTAEAQRPKAAESLRAAMARVIENTDNVDGARVMQELALLAVKSDVTEEIDRLNAHVAAAQDLLQSDGPIGRRLDFLAQEFNRESNTICSKSNSVELTRIGLDLKATIDQMREQVQNVE